jgi:hypothetical protein
MALISSSSRSHDQNSSTSNQYWHSHPWWIHSAISAFSRRKECWSIYYKWVSQGLNIYIEREREPCLDVDPWSVLVMVKDGSKWPAYILLNRCRWNLWLQICVHSLYTREAGCTPFSMDGYRSYLSLLPAIRWLQSLVRVEINKN